MGICVNANALGFTAGGPDGGGGTHFADEAAADMTHNILGEEPWLAEFKTSVSH